MFDYCFAITFVILNSLITDLIQRNILQRCEHHIS